MRKNTKKLTGAVLSALVIAVPALLLGGGVLFVAGAVGILDGGAFPAGFLAVYGLLLLAVVVGVLIALHQRRKEIQRGEEDEAQQY